MIQIFIITFLVILFINIITNLSISGDVLWKESLLISLGISLGLILIFYISQL